MSKPILHDLYDHQQEAFEAVKSHIDETSTVIIPTGGGKTFVQIDMVHEKANKTGGKVFVVLEPRINLAIQQLNEFYKRLSAWGDKPFRFMCVHSGRMSDDHLVQRAKENGWDLDHHQFVATTSPLEMMREYTKALKNGENLLVISTYHSAPTLLRAIRENDVDHVICDECHYLIQNDFQHIHSFWNAPYHHYTATQRHTPSDDGLGMNNVGRFGNVIHKTPVKELVQKGVIVEPRLVWVNGRSENQTVQEDYYASLVEIWNHQKNQLGFPPKLLVNATGTDQLHSLAHQAINDSFFSDVKIYHISSDSGNVSDMRGEWINTNEVSRREWVDGIKNETGECLIFHYDIVSEGIDVPGISGSAFFRSVRSSAKVMQIMGRTMRVLNEDRHVPIKDRKKQDSFIYVPYVTGMEAQDLPSMRERLKSIVEPMLRMGVDPIDNAQIINPTGTGEEEDDELYDRLENEQELNIVQTLSDEFMHLEDVVIQISEKFVEDEVSKIKAGLEERKSIEGKLNFIRQIINE